MAKQSKRLLALFIASVMCFSLCLPSFAANAAEEQLYFYDFETDDSAGYFAAIPGWNDSGTKAQFTIESFGGEWGKVVKYVNGPVNEQMRIVPGTTASAMGWDFSFCFDTVSTNFNVDFRQGSVDLYPVVLNSSKQVSFFETPVASYEEDVWYDLSIIFDTSAKYARLKFKESSSDEWKEFDGFYGGEDAIGTTGLYFDIYGGANGDGAVAYFDNMKVYIPGDEFKPSLSTYSDDFEDGINHAASVTDYTSYWKSSNTNTQTEIVADSLDGYEGNVLKLKDISSSTSQVNLTLGKYPFTDAGAPDVRHKITFKMGASFDGGSAAVYTKYVSPARDNKKEYGIFALKENQIVFTDTNGSTIVDAAIEPNKLYDVTYIYDAQAKVAIISVVDENGDTVSKFLDLGCFDSNYGYLYNIEFVNSSVGENTVYVDDFTWDISDIEFDAWGAYIKSDDAENADIDETVVFEYTDVIKENADPVVEIYKDGIAENVLNTISEKGNTIEIAFEELAKNSSYKVIISGVESAFGDVASKQEIEFVTSDYTVETERISISGDEITASLKSAYQNGVETYIVASAYDEDDNLTEVKFLPVEASYREAGEVTFVPEFDGEYSYMKAMVIRNLASGIVYSANIPSDGNAEENEGADDEYEAIISIESDAETFTIYGENVSEKDSVIAIQVLRQGRNWNDLADFDYETGDITEYLQGFDSVSDVAYGETYEFTQKLADGEMPAFRVRFGDGVIVYYDPILMGNINAAETAEELSAIVKADAAVWDEMAPVVEALTEEEEAFFWQILLDTKDNLADEGEPLSLPANVTELAPGISVLARLNTIKSIENMEALFETFASEAIFETNSYDIFAGVGDFEGFGMSDSQKSAFIEYIHKNINDYVYFEDFVKDFDENAIFYAIKDGSKQRINKILTTSDLIDSDEFPTYDNLSASKRNSVCAEIGSGKLFTSIEALEAAVEKESKAAKKANQESGGSGGGGGGGGSASSDIKGQPFVSVGEEDKEEVKELTFDDIKNVDWAQKSINELSKKGIVNGDGKGNFRPNDFVTREEFVKMLVLTLNISATSADENFDDIDASDWCQPYVAAAISKGIVNGIDDGRFGKGRVITREEMATMTYRAISAMGIMLGGVAKDEFADVDAISDWAKDACVKMQEAGIVNGMGDNHFAPKENVTRAQAAKILYEVLSR